MHKAVAFLIAGAVLLCLGIASLLFINNESLAWRLLFVSLGLVVLLAWWVRVRVYRS